MISAEAPQNEQRQEQNVQNPWDGVAEVQFAGAAAEAGAEQASEVAGEAEEPWTLEAAAERQREAQAAESVSEPEEDWSWEGMLKRQAEGRTIEMPEENSASEEAPELSASSASVETSATQEQEPVAEQEPVIEQEPTAEQEPVIERGPREEAPAREKSAPERIADEIREAGEKSANERLEQIEQLMDEPATKENLQRIRTAREMLENEMSPEATAHLDYYKFERSLAEKESSVKEKREELANMRGGIFVGRAQRERRAQLEEEIGRLEAEVASGAEEQAQKYEALPTITNATDQEAISGAIHMEQRAEAIRLQSAIENAQRNLDIQESWLVGFEDGSVAAHGPAFWSKWRERADHKRQYDNYAASLRRLQARKNPNVIEQAGKAPNVPRFEWQTKVEIAA